VRRHRPGPERRHLDVSGAAWTAFVPLGLCAVAYTVLGVALNRYRAPAACA